MRICGISDIHGNLLENIPKCDVLCIAGDVINLNDQRNFDKSEYWWKNKFTTWALSLPCKKILIVPGNHDFYLEYLYNENKYKEFCDYMKTVTSNKVHFLIDQSFEFNGLTFYGTPWIQPISLQIGKWAFESKDLENQYKSIPNCDVLITHDSPIKNKQLDLDTYDICKYHFYGHWHDGESNRTKGRFNCSKLTDYYSFKKNFKIPTIDITMEKTTYEILQEFVNTLKKSITTENELDKEKLYCKIDETFIKFLDNPRDKEDKIEWKESSVITDFDNNKETDSYEFL